MLQSQAICQENYERFVERVKQSREVWGLHSGKGWAYRPSNDHEGRDVLVFWSDRAYAARHAKEDWSTYAPASIPLGCVSCSLAAGNAQDQVLVGPNWDAHLCGLEVEPLEVARELGET
jgi:hypothetical protein